MKFGDKYIPERGDLVWLDFDPSQGAEIKKRRPALTLSPASYNRKVGLALFCPVTSHIKSYPFECVLPETCEIKGAILADHIKGFDWRLRNALFIARVPLSTLEEVSNKLSKLILISH